jgi:hypothetical protein
MSKGIWKLHAAAIRSVASTHGAPQTWVQWSPLGNEPRSNCGTITLGITIGGAAISAGFNICADGWTISKGIPAGEFGNCWNGSAGSGLARGVTYMIAVKVGQAHWPAWDITPSFNASLIP